MPRWVDICAAGVLEPERPVAAIVGDAQVAVVRLSDGSVLAVDHRDPFSGAYVMARGIVGSATVDGQDVPTLASPMYKQVFDLRTGACLSDPAQRLTTWPVREVQGRIELAAGPS